MLNLIDLDGDTPLHYASVRYFIHYKLMQFSFSKFVTIILFLSQMPFCLLVFIARNSFFMVKKTNPTTLL